MNATVKNVLLTFVALAMLAGFALAIPSGTLMPEARQRYLDSIDFGEDEFSDEITFEEDEEFIFFEE